MNGFIEFEPAVADTTADIRWAEFRLPPFPESALRVLKAVNDDTTSMRQLSDLITSDPALSLEVLIIANSALMAQRHPVTNVLQGALLLGTRTIKGVCLTVAVRAYLGKSINLRALRGIWRHTLACALIAEQLTDGAADKGTAYTAGIMHELGRFALAVIRPEEYAELLSTHTGTAASLQECERELFGFDYREAGRRMIEEWRLPVEFEVVLQPQASGRTARDTWRMQDVLQLSCRLADTAGFAVFPGCEVTPYEALLEQIPIRKRGLFHPTVKRLVADIGNRIRAIEAA